MDLQKKLDKIFSAAESPEVIASDMKEQNEMVALDAKKSKRDAFISVLRDNLKNGSINFEEATVRAGMFSGDRLDTNIILNRIHDLEFPSFKSASNARSMKQGTISSTEEQSMKDPIAVKLQGLSKRFPAYAKTLGDILKKEGWYLGTGDTAPEDKVAGQVRSEEEKMMSTQIKEGEKQMKDNEKGREEHLRASKKEAWHMGTGDEVDSNKWDKNVGAEEESRMKAEIAAGEKLSSDSSKEREKCLRAGLEISKVKLVKAGDDLKSARWEIRDAKTNEVQVVATISDIIDNRPEFKTAALEEITSQDFGNMILENIGEFGLKATASDLLGEDLSKFASDAEVEKIDMSNKDTSQYDVKNYGKTQGKGGKDMDFGKTENKVKAAVVPSLEKLASQYFSYRGIFADLKSPVSEFVEKTKIASVTKLLKKAEEKLDEVKTMIDEGAEAEAILPPLQDAGQALGGLNDVSALIEQAKGKTTDPELVSLLDQIEAAAAPAPAEGEIEIETSTISTEGLDAPVEDEIGDEKEEEKPVGKEASTSKLANRLKKVAAKGDSKDYDVTPKANFQKEFHGGEKKVGQDGAHFHNIWEIAKELEALGGKKATGKLAAMINKIKVMAEEKGISPKKYFDAIFGDAKATNEYLSEKTPEGVLKEWSGNTKGTEYAATVARVKKAYHAANSMISRGLLKEGKESIDTQVDRFMSMNDSSMNAYLESLENIAKTSEYEEGRIKVAVIDPAVDGFVIKAFVDNIPVARLTGDDLGHKSGKVTISSLKKAAALTKAALSEGMFDNALSDGAVDESAGETLGGLNIGLDGEHKLDIKDLL